PLPAVVTAEAALRPGAPPVHEAPWNYARAVVTPDDPPNLQSRSARGTRDATDAVLAGAAHVLDETYVTPAGHQGYLEPQCCVARWNAEEATLDLWLPNKTPYRLLEQLSACLGLPAASIELHPVAIGGDFGGKGSPMAGPLCAELSRLIGRPVRLALRYAEDLAATNPRHPSSIRVRIGCDPDGRLVGLVVDAVVDGGAYAGYKPMPEVSLRGIGHAASSYRFDAASVESRIAYTNTVPKGHARAPGSPQITFAVESALDELAVRIGLSPWEIRRRNVVHTGETGHEGVRFAEHRGAEVLDRAERSIVRVAAPPGTCYGVGLALYDRPTGLGYTSLRLAERADGHLDVGIAVPDTGTGSHTVVRDVLARALALDPEHVHVRHLPTGRLPGDQGVGGSRVTATLAAAAGLAAERWLARADEDAIVVELHGQLEEPITSYCAQVAQVAVDPATGEITLLDLVSVVDVGTVVHPSSHQSQIDGGATMGIGFALYEDLALEDGQVWAANLGEFKIPSVRDLPALRTELLEGGKGVGSANVKSIGELVNPPVAPAIANAVFAATGVRLRRVPLRAEDVWDAIQAANDAIRIGPVGKAPAAGPAEGVA
ncbi:MAG: xanthine dehydrogenase family protein molybdopterin-binding subunit, partial [Acidimicrobiales bacterium]